MTADLSGSVALVTGGKMLNGGGYRGCEVEPGAGEETVEEAGLPVGMVPGR